MSRVCVVGSLNIDVSYRVATLPVPGETVLALDRARDYGGKGGNQAIAVAVLGGDVGFIGAVGADEAGQDYLTHLRQHGVDTSGVTQASAVATGTAIVFVDDAGENLIVVDPGANSSVQPDAVSHAIRACSPSVVLAQLEIPTDALEAIVEAIPDTATFILNPAPMPPDPNALAKVLARVDILVPNRKELGQLAGLNEPDSIADVAECLTALRFERPVVVTLGADGAAVFEPGAEVRHIPAERVDPVDTTGAGDAFCGALATGLAVGLSLDESVREAVKVAGRSTTLRGAQLTAESSEGSVGEAH